MDKKLLRCPFCNAKPKIELSRTDLLMYRVAISCRGCLATIVRFRAMNAVNAKELVREAATEAWNKRVLASNPNKTS